MTDAYITSTAYDSASRLLARALDNGLAQTYTYDAIHRLTSWTLNSSLQETYAYSASHPHAISSLSNGNSYGYDANGNMTSRNVNGQSYYIGAHYQVENGVVTKYYLADAARIAMRKNGTVYYLFSNHLAPAVSRQTRTEPRSLI